MRLSSGTPARWFCSACASWNHTDEHGRILVTDHGSGNGTESQTNPPRLFEAHVPYVLAPGTTLRLGDVICRIDLV